MEDNLWFKTNPPKADVRPQDKDLWFRNKKYGWGWTPCSWQGWAVLTMYFFAVITNIMYINNHEFSNSDFLIQFFPQTYILTVFLLIICWAKGEKPRWQWQRERNRSGVPGGEENQSNNGAWTMFTRSFKQIRDFVIWIKKLIDSRD